MFMLDFDKDFFNFSRPIKDMTPYEIVKDEDRTIIIHSAVGVPEDEIKVKIDKLYGKYYLILAGEYKNPISGKHYSFNSRFLVDKDSVDNIQWKTENGLLYVGVLYKEPEVPDIKVLKMDEMKLIEHTKDKEEVK